MGEGGTHRADHLGWQDGARRGLVPRCGRIIDVGTGDGRLPAFLLEEGACARALALDISPYAVEAARSLFAVRGLAARAEAALKDGLAGVAVGPGDVVVVAGMGGHSIRGVLAGSDGGAANARKLILCPHGRPGPLRRWLYAMGYSADRESLCRHKGRLYAVIEATHKGAPRDLDEAEAEYGLMVAWDSGSPFGEMLRRRSVLIGRELAAMPPGGAGRMEAASGKRAMLELTLRWEADWERRSGRAPTPGPDRPRVGG